MATLEKLKKQRTPLRSAFTKAATGLEQELKKEDRQAIEIRKLVEVLKAKNEKLESIQEQIQQALLDVACSNEEYVKDFDEAEEYRTRFILIRTEAEEEIILKQSQNMAAANNFHTAGLADTDSEIIRKRKFKLPVLELKKFGGEAKEWLYWWSQFKKIDADETIVPEDKFQYLIQGMIPGSRAMSLVESFPPTADNYPKVIDQLRDRFAREDLLVQVYVRELLSMVTERNTADKVNLMSLYDQLESKLRALETMGRTQDKFADFLAPLVESCLPEDVLRLWERKRGDLSDVKDSAIVLAQLMSFLKREVENEEMFKLVRTGFGQTKEEKVPIGKTDKTAKPIKTATVSTLMTSENSETKQDQRKCIFCDKNHGSSECFGARNKTLEEKRDFLRNKNACFNCLKIGHSSRKCRSFVKCMMCEGRHYTIMCSSAKKQGGVMMNKTENSEAKTKPIPVTNTNNAIISTGATLGNGSQSKILLQTLPVIVSNGSMELIVRAILDPGSQRSYVSQNIVQKLRLVKHHEETVIHSFIGGIETKAVKQDVYYLIVHRPDKSFKMNVSAMKQHKVCGYELMLDEAALGKQVCEELDLSLGNRTPTEVELLIGADYLAKIMTGNVRRLQENLMATETRLGWTVMGEISSQKGNSQVWNTLHTNSETIAKLWRLDILGIEEPVELKKSKESHEATIRDFQQTVQILGDGRYQVNLPWKENHDPLPDYRSLAQRRWESVKNSLNTKNLMNKYRAVFQDWLDQDMIEEVPESEIHNPGLYLPHRPVIKESSTTKIRPVFDASASTKGNPSLNDCLQKGPNLIALIPDILDGFRRQQVGVISDIEKAFLQICVVPEHRDFLRFYSPFDDKICRHKRVVFGVSSSPFLLAAIINHHLDGASLELKTTASQLKGSFYVDNCVTSVQSGSELVKFIEEAKVLMGKGKMNLRGWESNISTPYTTVEDREVEVLGLRWNLAHDTLLCNLTHLLGESPDIVTKRTILSFAQKLFDPIGFTCPVTLQVKLILQKLWDLKVKWDEKLPNEWVTAIEDWKKHLGCLSQIEIPRFMGKGPETSLHVFVDASQNAFAACVFLRAQNKDSTTVTLLRAKSRVAPRKPVLTIPRLELMACCIGTRLVNTVTQNLKMEGMPVFYWSDSTTALWWITRDGQWTVFVQNRVREIRKTSTAEQWQHVPGVMNPADLPSRGCNARQLLINRWWEGPDWLLKGQENWPSIELQIPDENVPSEQKISSLASQVHEVVDIFPRVSKYYLILRIRAWISRFCYNSKRNSVKHLGPLSMQEINEAEYSVLRLIQSHMQEKETGLPPNVIIKDEKGIMRVKSPISTRKDYNNFRHPVLLPGRHILVERIIEAKHLESCHAGPHILLGILREDYWVLGGRRAVQKTINRCGKCRRYRTKPFNAEPCSLPADRVNDAATFEVTGVDLFGPVYLRDGSKGWVVLFTCAVYRALHLELVSSLSTHAFLQALMRFIARRGRPRVIYSDNGSNFRGSDNAFQKLDWTKIEKEGQILRIQWKFIPPSSAWWGGWWERLVGVVKDLLKKTLGKACLTYEEFVTTLCTCEAVTNSRPLTYLNEDSSELVPLTPALFLKDLESHAVHDIDHIDAGRLNRRYRYKQRLAMEFKKRFRLEYLGQLRSTWNKDRITRPVRKGEVVLVENSKDKRINWQLGRIVQLFPGKDGAVRRVLLQCQGAILERPIQKIYPMEVEAEDLGFEMKKEEDESVEKYDVTPEIASGCTESYNKSPKEAEVAITTRSGRRIKVPKVLGLFEC